MATQRRINGDSLDHCPIARAVRLVGDTWTLLIIRSLMHGPRRFNEIHDLLGSVSTATLSQRLKMLEATGLVQRDARPEIPPRVDYALTERGQDLLGVLRALAEFGERYLADDDEDGKPPDLAS